MKIKARRKNWDGWRKKLGTILELGWSKKKKFKKREVEKENPFSAQNPPESSSEKMEFQNWRKGNERSNV